MMRYIFGSYTLDMERHELLHAGTPIKLRPKVFRVLAYLVVHRDRMVPKSELLEAIWPNSVGEEVLNSCVMAARRAVGDDGRAQAVVKTMHGLGYRFVAEVSEQNSGAASTPHAAGSEVSPCGQDLQPTPPDADSCESGATPARPLELSTEQKTVTVLACGFVRADELAEHIGPEGMHDLMDAFFSQAGVIMGRYDGTIVQWLGDGFLALFGAPVAHEDDARRAALAALDLCPALEHHCAPISDPSPEQACRVSMGLDTGPVIVGRLQETSTSPLYTARGKTTDSAVRLRSAASPGTVLISGSMYGLIESEFCAVPWTETPELPTAYQLQGVSQRRAGVPRRVGGQLTRFVGRSQELAILRERLSRVETGRGQAVCISGAPGIGKSRLLEEFRQSFAADRVCCLEGHCFPYATNTPYLPLVELVRELCQISENQDVTEVSARIRSRLGRTDSAVETELVALDLLGIPTDREALSRLSPKARRARTFALLEELVFAAAAARPTIIVLEDLHWADASSEDWLRGFVARLEEAALLLLVTYRPPYSPDWLGRSSATRLALPPLTHSDSAILVRSILSRGFVDPEMADGLVGKAEGNPFFLEELTYAFDTRSNRLRLGAIPSTVQAVLAARIDRLDSQCKQILQICAVIGTPVARDLLMKVSGLVGEALDGDLRTLEEAELLLKLRAVPEPFYRFKHALTQEATYQSLPKRNRAGLHARIAQILERHFKQIVSAQPEVLARHHTTAGDAVAAVGYWQRAARTAYMRSANVEAISYATKGLDLLANSTTMERRAEQELSLQLALAPALVAAKGYGAAEVGPVYQRAQELCAEIGDSRQLFRTLVGVWNLHWVRGELKAAQEVAERLLRLARREGDPGHRLRAHAAMGEILLHVGELENSLRHLNLGIELYAGARRRSLATQIPEVVCLCYAAWVLWHLGFSERSLGRAEEALALAEELSHPMSLALCLALKSELHQFRLEVGDCLGVAERAVAVSRDQGLPFWEGTATIILGWAQAMDGELDRGHRTMQNGLELFTATGARVQRTAWFGMLAEIHCYAERYDDGLEAVREALGWVGETGEQYYLSELFRLKGALLLGRGRPHDANSAEKAFRSSLEIARRQRARMRELRAAVSLARLLRDRGRSEEAVNLLQPAAQTWLDNAAGSADAISAQRLIRSLS